MSELSYTYDAVGNRTGQTEAGGAVTTWTYDEVGQLVREQRAGGDEEGFDIQYQYDGAGNRTLRTADGVTTTYTYSPANRLQTAVSPDGVTTYTHDKAGNRKQVNYPGSGGISYFAYDAAGRMTQAETPGSAGPVTLTYNADGQRVRKETAGGDLTQYLYDFNNLLQEFDGDDDPVRSYTATDDEYGDLLSEYDELDDTGTPGEGEFYRQFDAQANLEAMTDDAGSITQKFKFQAFGLPASSGQTGWANLTAQDWSTMSPADWSRLPVNPSSRLAWGGQKQYYLDPETELYLLGMGSTGGTSGGGRYYDPETGRFLSEDRLRGTAGDSGGNLFRYVGNDPINKNDPSGKQTRWEEDEKRRPATLPLLPDLSRYMVLGAGGVDLTKGPGMQQHLDTGSTVASAPPTDFNGQLKQAMDKWLAGGGAHLEPAAPLTFQELMEEARRKREAPGIAQGAWNAVRRGISSVAPTLAQAAVYGNEISPIRLIPGASKVLDVVGEEVLDVSQRLQQSINETYPRVQGQGYWTELLTQDLPGFVAQLPAYAVGGGIPYGIAQGLTAAGNQADAAHLEGAQRQALILGGGAINAAAGIVLHRISLGGSLSLVGTEAEIAQKLSVPIWQRMVFETGQSGINMTALSMANQINEAIHTGRPLSYEEAVKSGMVAALAHTLTQAVKLPANVKAEDVAWEIIQKAQHQRESGQQADEAAQPANASSPPQERPVVRPPTETPQSAVPPPTPTPAEGTDTPKVTGSTAADMSAPEGPKIPGVRSAIPTLAEQPRNALGQFGPKLGGEIAPGQAAVDDFVATMRAHGVEVVGQRVTVRTPFGERELDVVLRGPDGSLQAVEVKSSESAFVRFDEAARQQFAGDRWINQYGADPIGQYQGIGRIESSIKILWRPGQ